MKKNFLLLIVALFCTVSLMAVEQTILIVSGSLATPLTVETSDGTYKLYSSLTINKLVDIRHVTDANGCWVVIPGASVKTHSAYSGDNKTENEHTRTYKFSMLYDSSCSGSGSNSSSSSSSSGSYSSSSNSAANLGANIGNAIAYAAMNREFFDSNVNFACNFGFNVGYGLLPPRTVDYVNPVTGEPYTYRTSANHYIPFGFDLSMGIRTFGFLTTCVGMATELEWKIKGGDYVVFSLPVYGELMFDFIDYDEVSPYIDIKVGNAFKWYDCLKKCGEYEQVNGNLYASIRFGWHIEWFDWRIFEYTYEGRPKHPGDPSIHMFTCGMGYRF